MPQIRKPGRSPRRSSDGDVKFVAGLLRPERDMPEKTYFADIQKEFMNSPHQMLLDDMDSDAINGLSDKIAYKLENAVAANSNVRFYILVGLAVVLTTVFANIWTSITKYEGGAHADTADIGGALFMMFQLLLTGGYEDHILHRDQRMLFCVAVMVGITLISILIGLITDMVNEYMNGLSSGTTKVVESGHTLILGWNESTPRALVQIAFIRRVYLSQNDTWLRRLFPFLRMEPSTPLAEAPIVVMTGTKSKKWMEDMIKAAFAARNVGHKHTQVGHDVVFRQGDPSDTHDLVRVAAHKATAVLVMMTEVDREESEASGGSTANSATIRTILALRTIIYSNGSNPALTFNPLLRVVVHLESPCKFLNAASFVAPASNRSVLHAQDLSRNINSLMFYCASKPGLSRALMALIDFDGEAFRCRKASELSAGNDSMVGGGKVGWFVGKTMAQALRDNGWENAVVLGCGERDAPSLLGRGGSSGGGGKSGGGGAGGHQQHRLSASQLIELAKREKENRKASKGDGLVNDPHRVITKDDYIIFVSITSSPTVGDYRNWGKLAKPYTAKALRGMRLSFEKEHEATMIPRHILVCGWRPEWNSDPARFRARVQDIGHGLAPGSFITCLNLMKPSEFNRLLESTPQFVKVAAKAGDSATFTCCATRHNPTMWTVDDPSFSKDVVVRHFSSDPTNYDGVQKLLESHSFDTAICLGSVVGKNLAAPARDARVLTMLLVLRAYHKPGDSMHVIAENQQDQTSGLAVCPPSNYGATHEPDFINTQAIIARSLVLNLAYPQMQDALNELLIHDLESSPEVEFITPEALGVVHKKMYFGIVQRVVLELYHSHAMCIGFFEGEGSKLTISPPPSAKFTWTKMHRLILIVRGGVHQDGRSSSFAGDDNDDHADDGGSSRGSKSSKSSKAMSSSRVGGRSRSAEKGQRRGTSIDRAAVVMDRDDDDDDDDDELDDGSDETSGSSSSEEDQEKFAVSPIRKTRR